MSAESSESTGTGAPATAITELVRQSFSAVSSHDAEGVVSIDHDDVVEEFVPLGLVLHGKSAVRSFFEELFAAFPDVVLTTEAIHAVGDHMAVGQWRLQGTFTGAPFQDIDPTGSRVEIRGLDVMEFEDGKLRHNTIYYDGLSFARQIGLLPKQDTRADRAMVSAFNAVTRVRRRLRR